MVKRKLPKIEIFLIVFILFIALLFLTFYIWYQAELIRIGLENQRIQEQINQLEEDIKRLEVLRSSLLSPERVEKIAREYLNLTEPDPGQIIYEELFTGFKK